MPELDKLAAVITGAVSTTEPLKQCHWLEQFVMNDERNQQRLHYLMDLIDIRWRDGRVIKDRGPALRMVEAWRGAALRDASARERR